MTRRTWILLLCAFETTWIVYMALLVPLAWSTFTQASGASVHDPLTNVLFVLPVVLAVSALAWTVFIAHLARSQASRKALWVLSFLLFGMVSLPIYYAVKIRTSAMAASTGT